MWIGTEMRRGIMITSELGNFVRKNPAFWLQLSLAMDTVEIKDIGAKWSGLACSVFKPLIRQTLGTTNWS